MNIPKTLDEITLNGQPVPSIGTQALIEAVALINGEISKRPVSTNWPRPPEWTDRSQPLPPPIEDIPDERQGDLLGTAPDAPTTDIYPDGACSKNPGPGGYAALIIKGGVEQAIAGGEPATTNNRMEMMGAIVALETLGPERADVRVFSDSQYLVSGANSWMATWKRKGVKTESGDPVKNIDLWLRLETAAARHAVRFAWIKGHSGHPHNEKADALAKAAIPR
jgi:ribonuclease HI